MKRQVAAAAIVLIPLLMGQVTQVAGARAQAPTALVVVSEDPYTNPGTYHRTQVEPISAAFGSTIVSVFQSGRSTNWGSSNFGWAVSSNAGTTWTDDFLPSTTLHATPPGRWQRVTDPAVAYDAKHDAWLIIGVGTHPCSFSLKCAGSQVFVSRSTDGARTFSEPILPTRARRTQFHDVPWITCDNHPNSAFYGSCYSVWNDDAHRQLLNAYTSEDGGLTWAKATIPSKQHCDLHPIPLVQANGNVVVPLRHCRRNDETRTVMSTDGGKTYVAAHSDLPFFDLRYPGGRFRNPGGLSLGVDADGTIYAAWPDCSFRPPGPSGQLCGSHNDIAFSTSTDGRHWSEMFRIPIDPVTSSVDHFLPALAVDPATSGSSAHIGIVYYFYPEQVCGPRTCQPSVGFVSSTNGGATWDVRQLAGPFKNTWFPLTDSGYMVGEYVGISFVQGNAIPVFPVAAAGRCKLGDVDSCNEWIASVTIAMS